MSINTLEDIEERAHRCLNGMTYNKEVLARNVLSLIAELRDARQKLHEAQNKPRQAAAKSPFDFF